MTENFSFTPWIDAGAPDPLFEECSVVLNGKNFRATRIRESLMGTITIRPQNRRDYRVWCVRRMEDFPAKFAG